MIIFYSNIDHWRLNLVNTKGDKRKKTNRRPVVHVSGGRVPGPIKFWLSAKKGIIALNLLLHIIGILKKTLFN